MIDIMKQGLGLRTPQQERFGNSQELKSFGGRYRTRTARPRRRRGSRTVCVSRWRGFAPTSSEKRLLRAINKQRQGITMEVVPCLLLCTPLYCAFRVNRGVRPYMAGTHVRRKKGRFLHIGVFFRLSVWYTRFSLTNRNLQDGETYGRIDTKMFMGNYRLI